MAAQTDVTAVTDCVIKINGEEFITGKMTREEARRTFYETLTKPDLYDAGMNEFALLVYKPRHNIWLRELMEVRSAPKA